MYLLSPFVVSLSMKEVILFVSLFMFSYPIGIIFSLSEYFPEHQNFNFCPSFYLKPGTLLIDHSKKCQLFIKTIVQVISDHLGLNYTVSMDYQKSVFERVIGVFCLINFLCIVLLARIIHMVHVLV